MRSLRHFLSNNLRLGGRDHSQYLITPNGEPLHNGGQHRQNGHPAAANGHSATDGRVGPNANGEKWRPADIGPVKRDGLVPAYLERHKAGV